MKHIKIKILVIIAIMLVASGCTSSGKTNEVVASDTMGVHFTKDPFVFEQGSTVDLSAIDFAYGYKVGIDGYPTIDTSAVGEKDYPVSIDGTGYTFKVRIVDTVAPEIAGAADQIVTVGDAIDVKAGITTDADATLSFAPEVIDTSVAGETVVTITAADTSGNQTIGQFKVTVKAKESAATKPNTGNSHVDGNSNSGNSTGSGGTGSSNSGSSSGNNTSGNTGGTAQPDPTQDYTVTLSNAKIETQSNGVKVFWVTVDYRGGLYDLQVVGGISNKGGLGYNSYSLSDINPKGNPVDIMSFTREDEKRIFEKAYTLAKKLGFPTRD